MRYSTFQLIRSYTILLKEKLYFCLICNTHFVWHRKKSTKLLFNPCSVKQPVMHIWTRRGFYDYLTTGGSGPSRWRRLRAQMAFIFMWRLWKTLLTSETFPFSLSTADIYATQSRRFPGLWPATTGLILTKHYFCTPYY